MAVTINSFALSLLVRIHYHKKLNKYIKTSKKKNKIWKLPEQRIRKKTFLMEVEKLFAFHSTKIHNENWEKGIKEEEKNAKTNCSESSLKSKRNNRKMWKNDFAFFCGNRTYID